MTATRPVLLVTVRPARMDAPSLCRAIEARDRQSVREGPARDVRLGVGNPQWGKERGR